MSDESCQAGICTRPVGHLGPHHHDAPMPMPAPNEQITVVPLTRAEQAERERDEWKAKFGADGLEVVQLLEAAEDRAKHLETALREIIRREEVGEADLVPVVCGIARSALEGSDE